jgi:hypothetical protein
MGGNVRRFSLVGATLFATLWNALPALADCDSDSAKQADDLVTFTGNIVNIDNCSTAAGKAAYAAEAALLKTLNRRNRSLSSICAASDPNWVFVEKTLKIQTDVFTRHSEGCAN